MKTPHSHATSPTLCPKRPTYRSLALFTWVLYVVHLPSSVQASAGDPGSVRSESFFSNVQYFGNLSAGPQWLRTDTNGEISKNGLIMGGSLSAEKEYPLLGNFGLSIGILDVTQEGTTSDRKQRIAVANPFLDLLWNHRLIFDEVEIGGVFRNFVGQGAFFDFSAIRSNNWALSVGPQIRYRYSIKPGLDLIGSLAILLSVNNPNRTCWQIPLQIGITLPFGGSRAPSTPSVVVAPKPEPSVTPPVALPLQGQVTETGDVVAGAVAEVIDGNKVKVTLPVSRVSFEIGQAKITREGRTYLNALAKIFVTQPKIAKSLEVTGHTDNRGAVDMNQKLSQKRAQSIAATLTQAGMPSSKLTVLGKGSSEPISQENTEFGWRRNRRVEIKAIEVENPNLLSRQINEMDKKYNQQ